MKKYLILSLALLGFFMAFAQAPTKPADTVVIKVGEGSKVIFAIQDKKDLETLRKYDFQALMNDLINQLEKKDTTRAQKPATDYLIKSEEEVTLTEEENHGQEIEEEIGEENWGEVSRDKKWRGRRTHHSFNFDIGVNNYVSDGKFPDQDNSLFTVKPWGSWYVGINSIQRTRLANKFFVEWGVGVSWYNFKFQNRETLVSKDDNTVLFTQDIRDVDFKKSKLTATYVNASIVPMLDFGSSRKKPGIMSGSSSNTFRIGAGPYVGYRIDSYTKQVFNDGGDDRKPKNHDNFYLNNIRYGIRMQMGFDDIDFFFNYDMNELFSETKGPKLNAFSFGVSF